MEAYLDNAATTKAFESVKDIMVKTMISDYGNPSSMHLKGMQAENYVKITKEILAKNMKVDEKEIIFTSGGTESNNMALIGSALANRRMGKHIITTRIEHASIYNPLLFLEEEGYRITFLDVDSNGKVRLEDLLKEICDDTILISIMYVNNEIGSIQDIEKIGKAIKKVSKDILFHVDAIQAFGKYKIYPKRLLIDLMSVSGHKIHGPKGSGFLYVRDKVKIKPIIYGGGQQKGMRSGTENVPAIAGLGKAVEEIYSNYTENIQNIYELKKRLIDGLKDIEDVVINGFNLPLEETAPHIVSASFRGVRSEVLLHSLEEKEIYVSSGSACASNHKSLSGTLKAIGVKKDLLDTTIRFSLSIHTTKEEIDYTIKVLKELLPSLRKYTRR